MPAFFAHTRGTVVRVTSRQPQGGLLPFRVLATGIDVTAQNTRAIITQAAITENGNYQFQPTLSDTIYAHVFGDQIGELRLAGLCFINSCNNSEKSGMQQIVNNYKKNKMSRLARPVQVSFGEIGYNGFLVGMTLEINDPETHIGQWSFRFNTFPGTEE